MFGWRESVHLQPVLSWQVHCNILNKEVTLFCQSGKTVLLEETFLNAHGYVNFV